MNIRVIDFTLLIFPALLLFITFYKSVFYSGTNSSEEYSPVMWELSQAKMLQAVACLGVILHHLTQHISSYGSIYRGPITILSSMGILFTSIFFFFTGYGLIVSVTNNPNYLSTFLRHRLSTVLVPFLTANILCVLFRVFYSHIPTMPIDVVRAIFGFVLLNGNGWYIVEVFFLYIAFYILFRFIKNKDFALILLCIFTVLLIRYSYGLGHDHSDIGDRPFYGEWWYNSTVVFIMGLLFARFKNSIVTFLKRFYRFILPATSVLFIIAFVVEERILKTHGYYRESITIDRISSAFITLIAQMIL
ncbi:MAG: acyltransferase [Lachnospiraceae bacterium]|nr:acyltransferase [Lachnospiraceae bacterium]